MRRFADRSRSVRRAWLAAPLGLLVALGALGACESTDSNRPISTKPGSTKRPVSKSPASWGAVSDPGASTTDLDQSESGKAP